MSRIDTDLLRLYPDPNAGELKEALSRQLCVKSDNIFVGNGSDEVLGFCFPAFFDRASCDAADPTPPVVFPDVTYSFYKVYASLYEIPYETIPLKEDYTVDPGAYIPSDESEISGLSSLGSQDSGAVLGSQALLELIDKRLASRKNQGVIIANPNAPTGIALPAEDIERIINGNPGRLVLVDEAYADFNKFSVVPLTLKYDNLLVVRTFSKSYALAGIRCGYAVGNKALIDALEIVKNSFNSYTLDKISQKIAAASCEDAGYYDMINERIINIRDASKSALRALGFTVLDSAANFLFVGRQGLDGEFLFKKLRERGILTRHFPGPRTGGFIRVTVGTDAEMEELLNALKDIKDIADTEN